MRRALVSVAALVGAGVFCFFLWGKLGPVVLLVFVVVGIGLMIGQMGRSQPRGPMNLG